MQFLYDTFPILLFFIVYKTSGIYYATETIMAAALIQVTWDGIRHRSYVKMHVISCVVIMILGSATLLLHNPIFIKWKPTIVMWLFGVSFLGSQWFFKKPALLFLMDKKLDLPHPIWLRLNCAWGFFFMFTGTLNLYIAYHYNTNVWIHFKLFGIVGLTLVFTLLQSLYLARYIEK